MVTSNPGSGTGSGRGRRRLGWVAAGLLVCGLAALLGLWGYHEAVVRPRALKAAGPVCLQRMDTDVPIDVVAGPATGSLNAAEFYAAALNAYSERRLPYLRKRTLDPFVQEPPLGAPDAGALLAGARQRECDFYARRNGQPLCVFRAVPGGRPWAFQVAIDPFAVRPYIAPLRLLAQAALNRGKALEGQRRWPEAETLYRAVARMGAHLRQHPGSMLDLTLALELERKAIHYQDAFYRLRHKPDRRVLCWRYGDSLARLDAAARRKYTQLQNPEVAMLILGSDQDWLWQAEAAFALVTSVQLRHLGWLTRHDVRAALEGARTGSDAAVRQTTTLLLAMPAADFRTREEPPAEGNGAQT